MSKTVINLSEARAAAYGPGGEFVFGEHRVVVDQGWPDGDSIAPGQGFTRSAEVVEAARSAGFKVEDWTDGWLIQFIVSEQR